MEKNPTQLLMKEHEIIEQIESIVNSIDLLWEAKPEQFKSTLRRLVYFFKEYSDHFHHAKEEDVLFPELCDHPDFLLNEIIDELKDHHELFREYTQEIEDLLNTNEYVQAYKTLKKYINDLLDHIAIENDELFSITENLFSENQLENMYFRFRDIDMELGEDLKKELENIPSELKMERKNS